MIIKSDFLVIGSGIAGLSFALMVADKGKINIVTKREASNSATSHAQAGIASVMSKTDSFKEHFKDTIKSGAGLCNKTIVETVVKQGPIEIEKLIKWGVNFTKNKNNQFDLTKEGGHSKRRVLHSKDLTGKEIEDKLLIACKKHPNIKFYENHIAIDLITTKKLIPKSKKQNRCIGAYILDINKKRVITFSSKTTLLATGGAGKVYLYTSNPDISSGDGIAIGYRAGCKVANMEFVQFHPTCFYNPKAKSFLISEAVRGEGGKLKLINGKTFMKKYDKRAELATRDIVARAIDFELKKRGDEFVLLDITHKPSKWIKNRFPNIFSTCLSYGLDITKNPIPVVPAAHYFCGGIVTNKKGKTNIAGLYAVGETAHTGLHGANRLASNSLLEAIVFADLSSKAAKHEIINFKKQEIKIPKWDTLKTTDSDEEVIITQNWDEIRRVMWNYVGIARSNKRLKRAKKRIDFLIEEIKEYYWNFRITSNLIELRNIALVAKLVIDSALKRKESRGLHYNIDYPRKKKQGRNTIIKDHRP